MNRGEMRERMFYVTSSDADRDFYNKSFDIFFDDGILLVAGMYDWPWLRVQSTENTVASQTEYTISTDFSITDLETIDRVTNAGKRTGALERISYDEYRRQYGDDARESDDLLQFYMRTPDVIGFYPTPASAVTGGIILDYHKSPTLMTADTDTPEWSSLFHHILVDYVAHRVWQWMDMPQEAAAGMAEFIRGVNEMKDFYDRQPSNDSFIFGDGVGRSRLSKRALETFNLPFD